jgi:hypothetical protein
MRIDEVPAGCGFRLSARTSPPTEAVDWEVDAPWTDDSFGFAGGLPTDHMYVVRVPCTSPWADNAAAIVLGAELCHLSRVRCASPRPREPPYTL